MNVLTPERYLLLKREQKTDEDIAEMYGLHVQSLYNFKRTNKFVNKVKSGSIAVFEEYFPEEVKEMQQKFLELVAKEKSREEIQLVLGLSRAGLKEFKQKFFPEMVIEKKIIIDEYHKEICKANGIPINTALHRIRNGMSVEMAVRLKSRQNRTMGEITPEHYAIAKKNGIDPKRVYQRYWMCGWEIERAITEPPRTIKKRKPIPKEVYERAEANGISKSTLYQRVNVIGWDLEKAATEPLKRELEW